LNAIARTKVLLIGAYGRVGLVLAPILEMSGYKVLYQGRGASAQTRFDPTSITQLIAALDKNSPDIIVNLAALTSVDECQKSPILAYEANTRIVETIAAAIQISGRSIHLIQISTDHLYDGEGLSNEEDIRPINMYAITKYAGELSARTVGATILRTNYIGRCANITQGQSISDWIVSSLIAKKVITLFEDVMFSPLHIKTLCVLVTSLLKIRTAGTYNLGSIGGISKADFGIKLASELNLDLRFLRIGKLSDANLESKRPLNMMMNCEKFMNQFKLDLPNIDQEISLLINDYKFNKKN
jgi:dTDP-4-dehydrorhamnose reductase